MDAALVGRLHLVMGTRANAPETRHEIGIPRMLEAIRGDLEHMAAIKGCAYPSVGGLVDVLTLPGTCAVLLFRFASTAHHRGLRPLSRFLYFLNVVLFGAELHPGAIIQPGLVIPHPVGIAFGGECRIGARALLCRNVAIGGIGDPKRPGMPTLGDDVVIFDSASLFGPLHVGDRSVIGTKALVAADVEADTFLFGVRRSESVRPLSEMGLDEHVASSSGGHRSGRRTALVDTQHTATGNPVVEAI